MRALRKTGRQVNIQKTPSYFIEPIKDIFLLKRNLKQDHFEEFHAKVKCECGEMIEKMNLETHKVKILP
jgi:hypothetical protein